MKNLWRLALAVTLALPLAMTDVSPSPTSAVGTWVSRSPSAALGIAIRADGEKYMVARGTALWGPMNWGSFVTTNSSPTVFSQSWSAVSVATNSSGTHCVAGESGAAITLRYSSNSCASWTQATLVAATTGSVNSVAISDNGQRMFATTSTGAFFASTTASPSFSQRSRTESWTDVATDSLGSVVFATTSDGQILKSTDSGVNFTQVLSVGAISINSVTLSSDGSIVFAADDNGVLRKSVDTGANWASISIPNTGNAPIADIATSADGSKVLIALDGGKLLRSTNGGGTWTEEDLVRNWKSVSMSSSGKHMGAGTSTNFYTSSLSLDISSSIPADGAVGVLNDANIVLNFNNKLVLGTGKNFYIRRTSDNSIFETIPVGDARVDYYSTVGRITINPQGTLALATSYYVNTDPGTVTDDHGNEWDSTNQQVRFTTSSTDNIAPTIVSKYPTSTTDRVTTTANISITFNENVRAVAGKFLRVCFSSGTTCSQSSERIAVTDNSRITVTGATVVINPEMELSLNSTHYVRVEAGAFEDLNGNGFAGINSDGGTSALTTLGVYTLAGDGTAPVFRRACMSLDRTTLHLLYDEQLVAGTLISGQFGVTISGVAQSIQSVVIPEHSAHVTIQMAGAMAIGSSPEISYTRHATSGGIQDSNSNRALSLSSIDASSTSDCAGPLMTTSLPARGTTDVSRNANIVVEFDETVQMQYGKQILIRNNTTSTNIETFSTNDTNRVTVSGNVLTIDPTLEFPANTVISLHTIDSGFVEDLSGNDFWGWGSSTYFTFTTASISDTVAPDATDTADLVDGSDTGSLSTDNITNDSTPTISVTAAENGGTVTVRAEKAGVFHTCQMSGSTSGATCTLPSLADGVWLITTVHADAIGNTSSRSAARSITIDTAAPTLSSVSPTTDATGVSFSSNIRVTFSETIAKGTGTISLLTDSSCSVLVGLSVRAGSFTSEIVRAAGTAETIAVGSSGITTSGSVVTFTPSATLATSTRHCVTYPAGVFTDTAGNNAPAMTLLSTDRVVFTTAGADVTSPSAIISSPASPASSRTLVYAVVFDEAINGLTSADFSNVGTSSCTFAVPTSSGTSFSVTATCTTDGTVIMRLAPNSVLDNASNTGPTSAVLASSVTVNATAPTTPTTAPSGTVAPTQSTVPASGTTVPSVGTGTPSAPAPVAQGVGTTVVPTTTTSVATNTTTTMPAADVPEVADGGGALVVNGQRIEATITRENNQLVIAAGVLRARISAVQREGGRAPLDSQGRIRMDQGDSIEIEVTGFGTESQVEVRMYSDPVLLGRSTVSALGSLAASYEVPESVDDGRHTVVLLGESQQGEELTFALAVFIGAESAGPSALALLVGIPLGLAVIAALIIPAIIRRRRKEEEEK